MDDSAKKNQTDEVSPPLRRVMVTGANGNLGRRLVAAIALGASPQPSADGARAVVRSRDAEDVLRRALEPDASPGNAQSASLGDRVEIRVCDYLDSNAMEAAAQGCDVAVHLVGIIKETARNSYVRANEDTTRVLVAAARQAGLRKVVFLSIVGSDPRSANACLASKGRAEELLLDSGLTVTVFRVPMVLGEGDYASRALFASAGRRLAPLVRAAGREQPVYAGDVVDAIVGEMSRSDGGVFQLAGPESLSRRSLVQRARRTLNSQGRAVSGIELSVPYRVAYAAVKLLERASANPPVTTAMLGVLDHDDEVDVQPLLNRLGLSLTSLDETLARVVPEPRVSDR